MRIRPLTVGCEVHGLHLATAPPSEVEFATLGKALLEHGLVVLRAQGPGLLPEHEVALYRRLGAIWTDGPLPLEAAESAAAADLGLTAGAQKTFSHMPGGYAEIGLIGNGVLRGHFGVDGIEMNPAAKHERANAEWHTDGPSRAEDTCVLSWMTCHAAPTGMTGGALPRWTTERGELVQQQFPAGATLFASSYAAFELAPPEEQAALRSMRCRYRKLAMGNVAPAVPSSDAAAISADHYPTMDASGTRPIAPREGMEAPEALDEEHSYTVPLVIKHPHTRREAVFCEPIRLLRLERCCADADGAATAATGSASSDDDAGVVALSWDDSQETVARCWRRAITPDKVMVQDWRPGDIVFWDNRAILHSRTPTDCYTGPGDAACPEHGNQRIMHLMRITLPTSTVSTARL